MATLMQHFATFAACKSLVLDVGAIFPHRSHAHHTLAGATPPLVSQSHNLPHSV
jgi:hypothetical protein